jgi:hypothetical protein
MPSQSIWVATAEHRLEDSERTEVYFWQPGSWEVQEQGVGVS